MKKKQSLWVNSKVWDLRFFVKLKYKKTTKFYDFRLIYTFKFQSENLMFKPFCWIQSEKEPNKLCMTFVKRKTKKLCYARILLKVIDKINRKKYKIA